MGSLLRLLRSMFQVRQKSSATGADVAAPLCCAQGLFPRGSQVPLNHDRLQRTVDVVLSSTTADQANADALVTGSRWKRVVSPCNTSLGVERSSISSNGVSTTDGTPFIPLCSSATPSANITSSISSTHEAISAPNSAQPTLPSLSNFVPSLFSACMPQTPFPSTTFTETLITSATFPSSASPIVTCRGLTSFSSSTSTSATSFPSHRSTVTVITFTTVRPQPSPSFTMSNPDTITLAPVNPTSTIIGPGPSQSGPDTTPISLISSTPFIIPTFVSSTVFSPIPSTSVFLTPIASPYPSISAISLSSISDDDPTIISTSTSTGDQTVTVSSVQTGALSTDTPHDTDFAHQAGAIIGVAIGGALFLLIIILSIFFVCKRYRSNRSYNSSMEDILAVSRCNTSWRPPLEADDDEHYLAGHGRSMSSNYPKTSGSQGERGLSDDLLLIKGGRSGSAESPDANGGLLAFRGQPPVAQTLHGSIHSRGPLLSPSYSNDSHGDSRPWWGHTEPLNINKRNSSQNPPLTGDSHVSAIGRRSASSLGFGGSSSSHGHLGPGSSGETLLPRGNRSTSIPEPRPIHKLSGRRHNSTPPTAFVGRDSSLEYGTQRIQHYQEEQNQQDRANKSLSQVILARIRASRRLSTSSTVKAYSQCTTTTESEESAASRAPSYMYSPSLLNPPISMSQTVPLPRGVTRSSYTFPSQHLPHRQDEVRWPDVVVTLPPSPSPVSTADTSSMVEGLLHPRLGMALGSSQQASATSLRDHEDYTRPINGLVNNHIRSTTTFETQNTVDLGEGGT